MNKIHNLVILVLILANCQDPEYLLDFDRGESTPKDIYCSMVDAFSIQFHFRVPEYEMIDSVVIYRASAPNSTASFNNLSFSRIGTMVTIETGDQEFIDAGGLYGQWNYYTALSFSNSLTSFPSDTVFIEFQVQAPNCSLELGSAGIKQTVVPGHDYLDGVRIQRMSIRDTLSHESLSISDSNQVFWDSISINYGSPDIHYSDGSVYHYNNIMPNLTYTYQIQSFQEKNGELRYSSEFKDSTAFNVSIPEISSSALSDSLVRVYITTLDTVTFDSFYVFTYADPLWTQKKKGYLGDLVYHLEKLLIDIEQTNDQSYFKIMIKNDHYYTISDSVLVEPLNIGGFRLVEGGNFLWGCNEGDMQCDSIEGPIQNINLTEFYMSLYEVTESAYEDITNWPPLKGELPAENISFEAALNYCDRLNMNYPEFNFFLPSEPEWEYAAKYNIASQSATIYPWANEIDIYQANYGNQNTGRVGVGSYQYTSHFGIYDMSGNVLEWTSNCFTDMLQDSSVVNNDCWVVARGGGFWHDADGVRTTSRYHLPRDTDAAGVGLRIAMRPNY